MCYRTVLFIILTTSAAAMTAPATAHGQSRLFDARVDHYQPLYPGDGVLADFNGDGHLDVAVTHRDGGDFIAVMLGDGDGNFAPAMMMPVDSFSIAALAAADLDGDGNCDLVLSSYYDNSVSVYLGHGDGTFDPAVVYPAGTGPRKVTVCDGDGDGIPDLLMVSRNEDLVYALRGNGDGTFQPLVTYSTGYDPVRAETKDLDGDGIPDMVVAHDDSILVRLGIGGGAFAPPAEYAPVSGLRTLVIEDFNGDQVPDMAASYYSSFRIYQGNGDGTFFLLGTQETGGSLTVADFDRDGRPDLALQYSTSSHEGPTITMLTNDGLGGFENRGALDPQGLSDEVLAGDVDGDGRPDLVVLNEGEYGISILKGRGDGTLCGSGSEFTVTYGNHIDLGDFDGDGIPDTAATVYQSEDRVIIRLGDGSGGYLDPTDYPLDNVNPEFITSADFDGDGDLDLVTANDYGCSVSVLAGNGDGTFGTPTNYTTSCYLRAVTVAEVNSDGYLDLVAVSDGKNSISVLPGNGDGTFGEAMIFYVTGDAPETVLSRDFDGDGHTDLAVANTGESSISIFHGSGDGTFWVWTDYTVGAGPAGIAIGDLDGDGHEDLAVACRGGGVVALLAGNGDGTFDAAVGLPAGGMPSGIVAVDLDGDGNTDIAVTDEANDHVLALYGNGDGAFGTPETYGTREGPYVLFCEDLNGDGHPDLTTVNRHSYQDRNKSISTLVRRPLTSTVDVEFTCQPASGTLPFSAFLAANVTNAFPGQFRRIQSRIDVTPAHGRRYTNWRQGWANMPPGETMIIGWWQAIPELDSLSGDTRFALRSLDVTPPPWNQPPYPPAGSFDSDGCTITGVTP